MSNEQRRMTDEERRVVITGAWLARCDDLFDTRGVKLEDRPNIFDDFASALSDLSPEDVEYAFEEWRRTGKRFPVPADLREILRKREESYDQYEAEKAWDLVRWVSTFFYSSPDTGILPLAINQETQLSPRIVERTEREEYNGLWLLRPKPFSKAIQHALDRIGGMQRVRQLPPGSEFDFARRDFLKAFRYYKDTGGMQFPNRDEAKQLIGELQNKLEEK